MEEEATEILRSALGASPAVTETFPRPLENDLLHLGGRWTATNKVRPVGRLSHGKSRNQATFFFFSPLESFALSDKVLL